MVGFGIFVGGFILKLPLEAHRLLFIPELLFDVFNVLEPEPTKSSDQAGKKMARRTLASCALVCKAWEEVATECLWRDLPSALCLLGILGSLTYRKDVNDKGWVSHGYRPGLNVTMIVLTVVK